MKNGFFVLLSVLTLLASTFASASERSCWERPSGKQFQSVPETICFDSVEIDRDISKLIVRGYPIQGEFKLLPSKRPAAYRAVIFRDYNSDGTCSFFEESLVTVEFTPLSSGKVVMHEVNTRNAFSQDRCQFETKFQYGYYLHSMN
ncbi:MAG: hypothetical protein A2Z97_05365 [Bdellovibrionales bacterium GWB1_52_6]|nr:MAG: hypothetical protein A2Z97_05365 [Bdellovibrionales bacterium GWB1_52_6]OFZ05701.1 MAG: hypothetical protein A2X97_03270 [Bdellovibrionales bacterium GWA1_52_35]HCM40364.1 hypothetical protein [Bdellovibrionales bacterium]